MKKNNKLILALVVVAALAMVSIAGVAMHSGNSDAALISNNIVIKDGETNTTDYSFYAVEGASDIFTFTVPETGKYTGTIEIGTAADNEGKGYVSYAAMQLADASAVKVQGCIFTDADSKEVIAYFVITNLNKDVGGTLPSGTYKLTQGAVTLGNDTGTDASMSFSGTVSAGDFSVTSSYTCGMTVGLNSDGTAVISGDVTSPNYALPQDKTVTDDAKTPWNDQFPAPDQRTLSLSGTASIQNPDTWQTAFDRYGDGSNPAVFETTDVNVTVEDGAVITAGDRAPSVATVSIMVSNSAANQSAYLVADDGWSVAADAGFVTDAKGNQMIQFTSVPFGSYTLIMQVDNQLYYSDVTVSESGLSLGGYGNYLMPYDAVAAVPNTIDSGTLTVDTDGNLTYDASIYTFQFAFVTTGTGLLGSDAGIDGNVGTISFDSPLAGAESAFVVLNSSDGMKFYSGTIGASGSNSASSTILNVNDTAGAVLDADEICEGTATVGKALANYVINSTVDTAPAADISNQSTLLVKGTMDFQFVSADQNGTMDRSSGAFVKFDGAGILSQGVTPAPKPTAPPKIVGSTTHSENLWAASYFVNETSGTKITASTYYFTTLDNALTQSNDITLYGFNQILKDTTFTNPNSTDPMKITIGPGASLVVGQKADPDNDVAGISAILTVPKTTTVVAPLTAAKYSVENGQIIYDVQPTPANNEPSADVLVVRADPAKYIYTDIATALNTVSVSGDVLNLRTSNANPNGAELSADATLKSGVTLNDAKLMGFLTVDEKVTLTVSGILNLTNNTNVINGTLAIVDGGVVNVANNLKCIALDGSINVMSGGVLNVKDQALIGGTNNSAMQVDGALNVNNAGVSVNTLVIGGNVSVKNNGTVSVGKSLQIGDMPTVSPLSADYTNTAVIDGAITLQPTATACVYGDFDIGKGTTSKTIPDAATLKSVQYYIEDNLYATLYNASAVAIAPLKDKLKDITITDWSNDPNICDNLSSLRLNAVSAAPPMFGDNAWAILYAVYDWNQYNVTLSHTEGVTWVVNGNVQDGTIQVNYGSPITVSVQLQPGYSGSPVIKAGSASYTAGSSYTVTGDVTFTVTGVQYANSGGSSDNNSNGGLTLIEILLIIIVIIIAIMAIIIAIRLLRS